jgi:hypothetical protein
LTQVKDEHQGFLGDASAREPRVQVRANLINDGVSAADQVSVCNPEGRCERREGRSACSVEVVTGCSGGSGCCSKDVGPDAAHSRPARRYPHVGADLVSAAAPAYR